MAAWLIPALKAVLPHVGSIISAAGPVFTRRKAGEGEEPGGLLQQQIDELQAAASRNAANVKDLAEQLQRTVTALEQAAADAETRLRRLQSFCLGALALSLIAVISVVILVVLP